MAWYMECVTALVDTMRGVEKSENSTPEARGRLFAHCFDTDPMELARASLVGLNIAILVDDIYRINNVEATKWQRCIRTLLIWSASLAL